MSAEFEKVGAILSRIGHWHRILIVDQQKVIYCYYRPEGPIPAGRARTRCPRCGARLKPEK